VEVDSNGPLDRLLYYIIINFNLKATINRCLRKTILSKTLFIIILCSFSKSKLHTLQKQITPNDFFLNIVKILHVQACKYIFRPWIQKKKHIPKTDMLTILPVYLQLYENVQ